MCPKTPVPSFVPQPGRGPGPHAELCGKCDRLHKGHHFTRRQRPSVSPAHVICSKTERRDSPQRNGHIQGSIARFSVMQNPAGRRPGLGNTGPLVSGTQDGGEGVGAGHRCGCPHGTSRRQGQWEAEAKAAVVTWWLAVLPLPGLMGNPRLSLLENLKGPSGFAMDCGPGCRRGRTRSTCPTVRGSSRAHRPDLFW